VLFTDLDGTLFAPGGLLLGDARGAPSAGTAEAVVAINRAGLSAVVTTGRNRPQCMELSRVLGWRAFIAELGTVIVHELYEPATYYLGDWPDDALLPGETPYEAIVRSGALDALFSAFPGRIEEHTPWHVDPEATHVLRGNIDLARARTALDALELPVSLIDNGIVRAPQNTLVGVSEVHAYHLVPKGVHKARAIEQVLTRRGLVREDAVAIGDSATDVEMADSVALGVMVRNALDDDRVLEEAARRDNVVATRKERGEGWTELANAWLAAHDTE
jgi:hypothetical protein